jgi:hypothetical protein
VSGINALCGTCAPQCTIIPHLLRRPTDGDAVTELLSGPVGPAPVRTHGPVPALVRGRAPAPWSHRGLARRLCEFPREASPGRFVRRRAGPGAARDPANSTQADSPGQPEPGPYFKFLSQLLGARPGRGLQWSWSLSLPALARTCTTVTPSGQGPPRPGRASAGNRG